MEKTVLKRGFGFWTGWFVVIGCTVGSGILTTPGPILNSTGSVSALLVVWVLGGMLALAGALTVAEMATSLPKAGGDYVYVREAFGPATGFVYGWAIFLMGFCAPTAVIAYTAGIYTQQGAHEFLPLIGINVSWSKDYFILFFSSSLIILFGLVHSLGHRESSFAQGLITTCNFLLLFVLGSALLVKGSDITPGIFSGNWNPQTLFASSASLFSVPFSKMAHALILVMYAYTGWNAAVYIAGEIKNPEKLVPRALLWGCGAVLALYFVVNLAYVTFFTPQMVGHLEPDDMKRLSELALIRAFGNHAGHAFSLLVSVGIVAALSSYILTGPRIVYAMAFDGLIPKSLGTLGTRSGIPVYAVWAQCFLSLLLLWSGTFDQVLNFTGFGLSVVSLGAVVPIFFLRRRKDLKPAFRTPFYPWLPLGFIVISLLMLGGGFVEAPKLSALSLLTIFSGFPVYAILKRAGYFLSKSAS